MGKIVEVKIPQEYFEKDRNNELEARLAKFDLQEGDTIRFLEYDKQDGELTGKFYDRKVVKLHKIHKATKYWTPEDLEKYGIYIFQLTDV